MQTLGYRIVDMLAEHFETIQDRPVSHITDRATLEQRLREPVPEQGAAYHQDVLEQVRRDVFAHMMHVDHPRIHVLPEYLQDIERDLEEVDFYDYGIQLTRGFRALKLWMSLKVFGLAAFRAVVEPMVEDGFALVMSTVIKGQTVLRFCTINPRTTEDDIRLTIEKLEYYARRLDST